MSGRVLCGYMPDRRGNDALALAALYARVIDAELIVANVYPPAWPVQNQGAVDLEWRRFLIERSREALTHAEGILAERGGPAVRTIVHANRGSGRGLAEVAAEVEADVVIIGSAPGGARARVAVGSTADQLLHGSPVPVMLAPKGYAKAAPEAFERITITYRRRPEDRATCRLAALVAVRLGIPLRVVHVLVRATRFFGASVGFDAEAPVLQAAREAVEEDLSDLASRLDTEAEVTMEVLEGDDVAAALASTDWLPGEVAVCGSSETGPIRRVFLGDMSMKLLRNIPCPVLVLPRGLNH
ncbi:MAG TPA: universal stress protein [Streptosporangiaceae bacterium]